MWISKDYTTTIVCLIITLAIKTGATLTDKVATTELANEPHKDQLLLFATLSGDLVAIEQSGRIRWKIKDQPIVQVPVDTTNAIVPIFLPDPRDGSLYLLGGDQEPLRKLPFTIPQLVASSPCRSSDGILYTGKKKDTWYKLDPKTGKKDQILGWDTSSPTCPIDPSAASGWIFMGRTKYDIMMVDSRAANRKWNVTYYDYASQPMTKEELNNYDLVHFASSSSGRLVTMDRRRGHLIWDGDLGSPIVAAYVLTQEGLLVAPFTSLANHTLNYLTSELLSHEEGGDGQGAPPHRMKLYPTLYVGDHRYGLYALPSLVDQNVVTITASDGGPLLLGGPHAQHEFPTQYSQYYYPMPGYNYRLPSNLYKDDTFQSLPNMVIYMGHYDVPTAYSDVKLLLPASGRYQKYLNLITDASMNDSGDDDDDDRKTIGTQTEFDRSQKIDKSQKIDIDRRPHDDHLVKIWYKSLKLWINQQENKGLKVLLIILVGCVIAMFFYLQIQVREFQNMSQNNSKGSQKGSATESNGQYVVQEIDDGGVVRVGKITFQPTELLGKGCEGTFVYRGEFDSRKVAVKRLLPECFVWADREVALLRESDAHPHVIRYYCMEQDRLFRYIALELCQATLSDYVQGQIDRSLIAPLDILRQATSGLEHLHSLDIVHRDIKPHNVLLSMPNNQGVVKAMISDFGLCKKLQVGKRSFSRRSGVTGTDGWIAPEMLDGNERTTCAVDLFSLGCLFYYVLSNGSHPFGDALRRQANILNGEWSLHDLKGDEWEVNVRKPLLAALISAEPERRPCCPAILKHPMFWDCSRILSFLQDVSDRVEKADSEDRVLQSLETNNLTVVRHDWMKQVDGEIVNDLRKYRSYRGDSVRDLLRALRNKKHHFRELTSEARHLLGEIPNSFTAYWTSKFPLLLVHAWITMQCVAKETSFTHYYHDSYVYSYSDFLQQIKTYMIAPPPPIPESHPWEPARITTYSPKRNVGLYRNLADDETSVGVEDVNFTMDNFGGVKNRRDRRGGSRPRGGKRASKRDEPLVWNVRE